MIENIDNTLDFCKEIIDWDRENEYKIIDDFFISLLPEFNKIYEQEKVKLPYHINLLDEIHANENAHSRIFMKLLCANDQDEYYILNSFLHHLGTPFSGLNLSKNDKIDITSEQGRIDVWIRAKEFSLIIENKIHGAIDQEKQIIRYVIETEESNCSYSIMNNIYVLYLSRYEKKEPSESSLPKELREELGDKYKSISYRKDILPWLEIEVLPNCKAKDTYLTSAIAQYIDHLNGLFNQRKIEIKMKEELKKHLHEKLNLNGKNLNEQIEEIDLKLEEVNKIISYLNDLRIDKINKMDIEWLKEIKNKMMEDYPSFNSQTDDLNETWPKCYLMLNFKNWPPIKLVIEINQKSNEMYFGIFVIEEDKKELKIIELIKDEYFSNFENESQNPWWYTSKYSKRDKIYSEFRNLIRKLTELIQ